MATRIWTGFNPLVLRQQARYPTRNVFGYDTQWWIFRIALVVADAIVIWASLQLAYHLRITSGLLDYEGPRNADYISIALLAVPIWLGLFAVYGLYRPDNLLGGLTEYQHGVKACTTGIVALIVLSYLSRDLVEVSRGWLILSWVLSCSLVTATRFTIRRVVQQLRRKGWLTANVLIVGANTQGVAMATQWLESPASGMRVVGFLDDFKPEGTQVVGNLKVIASASNLVHAARTMDVQEVVVVPNAIAWETFEELIAQVQHCKGFVLRLSTGFYELLTTGVAVTNKSFVPLFTINDARIVGVDAVMKRVLDYILALPLSLVSLPLCAIIGVILKLNRPDRPALSFKRTVGQGGETFSMPQFNVAGAKEPLAPSTMFERFLYRSGWDKLPQFFHVLAGNMSLVGPRPRVLGECETDPSTANNLRAVKPGIVGPWIVSGLWTSPDESRDELYYIRNWTIGLDVQILLQVTLSILGVGRRARTSSGKTMRVNG